MQRRFVHRKGSFHCRCRAALGVYYGGLQITLRPEHGSDAELRGCEMCDEKNYCFSFCSPSPVEKRILSLSEGKNTSLSMGSARAGVCAFKSSRTWTVPSKQWQSGKEERKSLIHRKDLILSLKGILFVLS